jgi:hypothetical protein
MGGSETTLSSDVRIVFVERENSPDSNHLRICSDGRDYYCFEIDQSCPA